MFGEFEVGPVGPDDDEPGPAFIPKQVSPEENLKNEVKLSEEAGLRKVTSVIDVMEDDEKLQFVIEDLLPDTGLMYVGGLSGTGKTILAIQMVGNIILNQPTMSWRLGSARTDDFKVLFLSLEMGKKELQLRLQHMYPNLTDEERKAFLDRFLCYSRPEPFEFWNPVHVLDLVQLIKFHNINMLLVDSASVSFASELTNQKEMNESIKKLYMLRSRFNCSMVVVAHTRKPSMDMVNNPENVTLNELFGHSAVANSASSIIIMLEDEAARKAVVTRTKNGEHDAPEKTEKLVHIVNAKSRFGVNSGAFKSYLTAKVNVDKGEPLMFRRNAIPIAMTEDQKKKLKSTKIDLADALSNINFDEI